MPVQASEIVLFEEVLDLALKFLGTPADAWKKADKKLKIQIHKLIFEENPRYSANKGFGTPKLSIPFYIKDLVMGHKNGLVVFAGRSSEKF